MDVPAQIMQDRTMVPIRAVAVAFDANVAWDGINYVIDITTDGSAAASGNYSKQIHADDGTLLATVSLTYSPLTSNSTAANKINKNVYDQISQKASVITVQMETAAKAAYTKESRFLPALLLHGHFIRQKAKAVTLLPWYWKNAHSWAAQKQRPFPLTLTT